MNFETINQNDLNNIMLLQPDGWPGIDKEFEFYIQSDFCNPVKVTIDEQIVGIGASIAFENTAWLAHIIVDHNFRNKGIGFKIVDVLVKHLNETKPIETFLLIATEIGRPVYLRYGFRDVCSYLFMKREKTWITKPDSDNILDFKDEYRSAIYALDFLTTGEKRESLIEPHINSSKAFIEDGIITGYFLPTLREGLIYAQTEKAGIGLMNLKYSNIDKAVLPSRNIAGIKFLKENGFIENTIKGTRMILGKDLNWKPANMYSRISGNFG